MDKLDALVTSQNIPRVSPPEMPTFRIRMLTSVLKERLAIGVPPETPEEKEER